MGEMRTMPGFEIAPWELDAAAAAVRTADEQLRDGLARLALDVQTLLDGWRGAAGSAFARAWDGWYCGAIDVLEATESMARLLGATGRGYVAAETANVGAFTR
jgi:WXG100 family type VII secretion target